jgi:putative ABC transport system permease protein
VRPAAAIYACRLAGRELRGGLKGLRVFLACLILGVATIAGIGSLAASVVAGIKGDARELLGGDVEARLPYREPGEVERAFLARSGEVSTVAQMRAMARDATGERHSLIELKAVDAAYPLYGAVELKPAIGLAAALEQRDGRFGAVVDPALMTRLRVSVGDAIRIGNAVFAVRATLEREPDAAATGLVFGPPVIIAAAALAETRLIQPGALVTYHYRLRLPPGVKAADWAAAARAAFPETGWKIRTFDEASPGLQRLVERVGLYLSLVGLAALLVGGVGIGNAVGGYIAGKTDTIATLKCLGASTGLIYGVYLVEILVLALGGIVTALILGALFPLAAAPLIDSVLPVSARLGLYPQPLALAALFGFLTTLAFSLWPLTAVGRIKPGALFRDLHEAGRRAPPMLAVLATAFFALTLAALVVASAPDRTVAVWFVAAAVVAFALFRLAGSAIEIAARLAGRPRHVVLRLALANVRRPGAPTGQIVLSLGTGLSVLVAVGLVENNLAREIETRIPAEAPGYFFIDIQPDQLEGFAAAVRAIPGARSDEVPMMRGRITRLNGVPVEIAKIAPDAEWALRNERGLTYAAAPPPGARIVAGSWWPADYRGPPLISFDAALAKGMGLTVGDTLSVDLLGREITGRIANLRAIDWVRIGINFAVIFAPGTLENAPQTHLAAVYVPPAEEEKLVQSVTERFPNISAIHVREALDAVARIVGMIGDAIRLTALITLASGVLVLAGAIAAGQRRRVYDAVVLKVLGATPGTVAAAYAIEHALIGAAAALAAGGFGVISAYFLVTRLLRTDWAFVPGPLLLTLALATVLTILLGFLGTWRALAAKPAAFLRNE